ncbi:MAG TPA: condensation domain-containing protein, partial [Thermoanaerobaculia bacterium]|nr:condensation domain-containing protein [Thermoanaerobaculia bacterium]
MKPELSPEKLALLVLRAQRKRQAEPAATPDRIPRRGAAGPAPLSFAQQRLWLLDQLEPGSTAYNMAFPLRLRGGLDVARLAAAWGEVVRRHEALRTTFRAVDGVPVQVVAPPRPGPFPLFLADLSGLPEPAREREAERLVARQLLRPFDLERGPLVRGAVLRLGEGEQVLFGDLHHIIADGWSISVFCRELSALYGAGAEAPRDTPSPLPALPIQLADFAVWQRERLTGAVLAEQLGYWRRRLAGVPPVLELPTDRLRPAVQTHRGGFAGHTLPPDLADRLRQLARREGASLFMPLLAGFALLLGRLAGQTDVVVGSPSAGRDRVELEGLIGLFLNTLVLRADLAGDPSFRQLLDRVKDDVLGAYQHQELPFEALIEALQPERLLDRTPIFQVLFNYVSLPDMRLALPGIEALGLKAGDVESKFDLTLYLEDTSGPIELQLVYNALLFDPERMEEMLRQLAAVLAQVVADPAAADIRIGSLSLVTAAAAALLPDPHLSLSDAWHGPTHRQLSRHAAAEPERLAVADESGEAWAYGELEARSNQLARHLLVNGVGRGDAVAVWAHRGASLAWALLGIHKAGAAFLVLDPTYPAARLQQYLRIARPAGWLEVAGAPDPPEEVVAEMAERTATCRCRLVLPHRSIAARNGFLAALPATDPEVPVGPDDAACLTFTSGSTGTPKAVVGRHGPLTHFHPWLGERFGLSGDDCFGLLSALAHDPLQRDVLTPLWFGAAIAVPDPLKIDRPGYLAGWARRTAVTVLNLTPAMLDLLCASAEDAANAANAADPAVAELPDLRRAF